MNWIGAVAVSQPALAVDKVTVFAAASLKNALDAANAEWRKVGGAEWVASYGASSALARQIEAGAPADIFISADLAWMDYLEAKNLVKRDSRFNLLGNSLVLIAPRDVAQPVDITHGFDLAGLLRGGRLAMGAVDSVPAGRYGKEALESLGVWSSVENQVAGAESVRAALALVSRGEAPLGVVYKTDAIADPQVAIVATFPQESHTPIIYPVAILVDSNNTAAAAYLEFIRSDRARPFFERAGFNLLN